MERGYLVHFENNSCKIYDNGGKGQVVANIKMEKNKNFPLIFSYSKNVALKMEVVDESRLWHRRLGHLNFQSLKTLQQKNLVYGLPSIQEVKEVCEGCALGKHHRESFSKENAWRAKAPLELVHTDVCGPMTTPTHADNRYFLIFVDDFTRMTWLYFMRQSPMFSQFSKSFKVMLKDKVDTKRKF